jgi:hypothetical protein
LLPALSNSAPWLGHRKLAPLTTLMRVPACGQIIEKAEKLVALVRTTATGVVLRVPTLPATPPTLASAGQGA